MTAEDLPAQRDELLAQTEGLRAKVNADSPDDLLEAIGALEVAQEELRVAEEELQLQRDQISVLLERHEAEAVWRARVTGSHPLALVETRRDGVILQANSAAAVLFDRRLPHLAGKPLVTLVAPSDHSVLRDALTGLARGGGQQEAHLRILAGGQDVPVTLVGTSDGPDRVHWALLPETHATGTAGKLENAATLSALAEMCSLPLSGDDRQKLLHRLAELAQQAVPRAAAVSLTLGSPEEPEQLSSDRTLAFELDAAQMRSGEGPCVDAFRSREVVRTDDIHLDPRWPRLRTLVTDLPVGGTLAVPIAAGDDCPGVLNAYSLRPTTFQASDIDVAQLVGDSVSAVLRTANDRSALTELADNLHQALTSRAVIDQAKGMVMARHHCDADEAFARMSALSQRSNLKLRVVAQLLVDNATDTGSTPPAL